MAANSAARRAAAPAKARPSSSESARQDASEGALRAPKTAELIADWMRDHIRRNQLKVGDPLPSEEDLKRRFGASRPTVREAMRILEVRQLVRITRGATGGARYHLPGSGMVAEPVGIYLEAHQATQEDLTVARLNIEPSIMAFVAERASMKDLERLRHVIDTQAALVDDLVRFSQAHEDFYEVLADICGNITLSMFVRILRELMHAQMELMGNALMFDGELAHKGRRDHVRGKLRLMEFLVARDREGADRWWRRHLKAQLEQLRANGHASVAVRAPRRGHAHG